VLSNSLLTEYRFPILISMIFVVCLGIRFYRLEMPESYYFDEVYFAFTAQEMAKGNRSAWESTAEAPEDFAYEWTHPPLGKEISAIGILLFGDNTFGWRFFQALFGSLGVVFIYLLGKNLFQDDRVGIFAALLYCFDAFLFTLSRITMVDIFMVDFILLSALFLVKFARTRKTLFLFLTGVCSGGAMSIKWNGVYVAEFMAGVSFFLLYYYEVYRSDSDGKTFISDFINLIPRMFFAFILVPFLVYLLTYLPFFYHGNSFMDFLHLQDNMYGYHGGVTETHPYMSEWWKWPLILRPVYFYFEDLGGGIHAHIYALGNPFIWWTGFVFLILGVIEAVRKESPALIFAVVSVFALWLPWAFSPRKITFLYHFVPSLLFIFIITAYYLNRLWTCVKFGKALVGLYLIVAVAVFIYFYPVISATPVQSDTIERFMWLDSWR